jgi:VWFA-related protein
MRACSAILLSMVACAAWGQEETPVFRATSDLVLLDVQVVHNKTKTATGVLAAKDFVLSEDGAPQEISVFAYEQFPLSIVLLFDLTQSVRGVLRRLAGSAATALRHLGPEDEVAVMEYAASAHLVQGFTTDRQSTVAAIRRAAADYPNEAAFFNEAIFQAARQLQQSHNPTSRRVIIWLTDNFPNAPSDSNREKSGKSLHGVPPHTEDEAIRALHESGTVVTALLLKDPLAMVWAEPMMLSEASARKKFPAGDAHKYAEITGGFSPGLRGKNVEQRLAEAIDDLRSRYTVGYRPSEAKAAGTFCRVRVALAPGAPLRPQEWRVLVREGYYRK